MNRCQFTKVTNDRRQRLKVCSGLWRLHDYSNKHKAVPVLNVNQTGPSRPHLSNASLPIRTLQRPGTIPRPSKPHQEPHVLVQHVVRAHPIPQSHDPLARDAPLVPKRRQPAEHEAVLERRQQRQQREGRDARLRYGSPVGPRRRSSGRVRVLLLATTEQRPRAGRGKVQLGVAPQPERAQPRRERTARAESLPPSLAGCLGADTARGGDAVEVLLRADRGGGPGRGEDRDGQVERGEAGLVEVVEVVEVYECSINHACLRW